MPKALKQRAQVLPPIVTFDFPKQVAVGKTIQLVLHLKNQGTATIDVDLSLLKHLDFLWVGKTKHLCSIEPEVSFLHA